MFLPTARIRVITSHKLPFLIPLPPAYHLPWYQPPPYMESQPPVYLNSLDWDVSKQQHHSIQNHRQINNCQKRNYVENRVLILSSSGHSTHHISKISLNRTRLLTNMSKFIDQKVCDIYFLMGSRE